MNDPPSCLSHLIAEVIIFLDELIITDERFHEKNRKLTDTQKYVIILNLFLPGSKIL